MKKMLINATDSNELRVALTQESGLYDLDIERIEQTQKKSNIYKAKITTIAPSLNAAFVEFGANRQGFLPFKEIAPHYFQSSKTQQDQSEDSTTDSNQNLAKQALKEGQELIVQVEKEERGNKGAALTTYISLAGSFLVLMPNNPRAGGVSRRIEGEERDTLKKNLAKLNIPKDMGLIIRTAGVSKTSDELQWDLDALYQHWQAIVAASKQKSAPFLIHKEGGIIIRSIRDHLRHDVEEIIIDDKTTYEETKHYLAQARPQLLANLTLYQNPIPLFNYYEVEKEIETAFLREVRLPSGGSIVIDQTEALVAIDINSSRATKGSDIEETALQTNLEAADEIAKQLRLRDMGGLIVIDFIDMTPLKNQRAVEDRLHIATNEDRARVQSSRISRFGLLELSRQRIHPNLSEAAQLPCTTCQGRGMVRSIMVQAKTLLRSIEDEAMKAHTGQIQVQLPVELATYILNELREQIFAIEKRQDISLLLLPNPHIQAPEYRVTRITKQSSSLKDFTPSYRLIEAPNVEMTKTEKSKPAKIEKPAVTMTPTKSSQKKAAIKASLIKRLWKSMFGTSKPQANRNKQQASGQSRNRNQRGGQQRRRNNYRGPRNQKKS